MRRRSLKSRPRRRLTLGHRNGPLPLDAAAQRSAKSVAYEFFWESRFPSQLLFSEQNQRLAAFGKIATGTLFRCMKPVGRFEFHRIPQAYARI